jgi:hypothetical protein
MGNAFHAFSIRIADHELLGDTHPLGVQEVGCGQLMQDSQLVRVVAIQDVASCCDAGNVASLIGIGPQIDAHLRVAERARHGHDKSPEGGEYRAS